MVQIPLTQGKFALIDDEDFERVSRYKWTALYHLKSKKWYARRSIWSKTIQKTVYLHRLIMNAPKGIQVDHKNGNGLDNQKSNLRLATSAQNRWNSQKSLTNNTAFFGVSFTKNNKSKPFYTRIQVNNKTLRLGSFTTAAEAALAYDEAAKLHHGEFARLNFPDHRAASRLVALYIEQTGR